MKNYKRKILVFITAFMMLMSTGTGVFAVDDVSVDGEAEAQPAAAEEGNTAAEESSEERDNEPTEPVVVDYKLSAE